jgi:membrane protease YdiL (CAAX protease family)
MTTAKQRVAIEITAFVLCFFAVWSVRATVLYSIDESIASDTLRVVYSNLVKFLFWVAPAILFVRWVRRTSPYAYLGLSVLPSKKQWQICLGITGLFLSIIIAVALLVEGKSLSFARIAPIFTLSGILFHFFSPWMEEVLFRGLLLKEFQEFMPKALANLVTSLLFVGVHLPYWLTHEGFTATVLTNSIGIFIFSLVAGWLYLKSNSLWPPTLAHILNNFVAVLLQ